jgi:hypothetical protein
MQRGDSSSSSHSATEYKVPVPALGTTAGTSASDATAKTPFRCPQPNATSNAATASAVATMMHTPPLLSPSSSRATFGTSITPPPPAATGSFRTLPTTASSAFGATDASGSIPLPTFLEDTAPCLPSLAQAATPAHASLLEGGASQDSLLAPNVAVLGAADSNALTDGSGTNPLPTPSREQLRSSAVASYLDSSSGACAVVSHPMLCGRVSLDSAAEDAEDSSLYQAESRQGPIGRRPSWGIGGLVDDANVAEQQKAVQPTTFAKQAADAHSPDGSDEIDSDAGAADVRVDRRPSRTGESVLSPEGAGPSRDLTEMKDFGVLRAQRGAEGGASAGELEVIDIPAADSLANTGDAATSDSTDAGTRASQKNMDAWEPYSEGGPPAPVQADDCVSEDIEITEVLPRYPFPSLGLSPEGSGTAEAFTVTGKDGASYEQSAKVDGRAGIASVSSRKGSNPVAIDARVGYMTTDVRLGGVQTKDGPPQRGPFTLPLVPEMSTVDDFSADVDVTEVLPHYPPPEMSDTSLSLPLESVLSAEGCSGLSGNSVSGEGGSARPSKDVHSHPMDDNVSNSAVVSHAARALKVHGGDARDPAQPSTSGTPPGGPGDGRPPVATDLAPGATTCSTAFPAASENALSCATAGQGMEGCSATMHSAQGASGTGELSNGQQEIFGKAGLPGEGAPVYRTLSAPSSFAMNESALELVAYDMALRQPALRMSDPRYISHIVRAAVHSQVLRYRGSTT